ncbi:hypothetical protein [Marinobacter sp.]|uniref:hypothetical protein n=1 Tax=Marinobacter sp. TaxID=50741 RepID=UPI003A93B06D
MKRIIVSTQRSGLNWLRYNIEYHAGLRTPGKELLISPETQEQACFIRSHDPLGSSDLKGNGLQKFLPLRGKKKGVAWERINPKSTKNDIIVLLLRDYRESFVRTADKDYSKFDVYLSNIRFFVQSYSENKAVFYYEDFVKKPSEMYNLLSFLQLSRINGNNFDAEGVASAWDSNASASVEKYSVNQAAGGGAMTKKNPDDFKFHQSKISMEELDHLKTHVRDKLKPAELDLINRYLD